MSRLEEELRNAMRREEPPEDFAERVIAAAGAKKQQKWLPVIGWRSLRWALAVTACLVIMIAGMEYWRVQEERARGKAAKEQLMLALRIAGSKLQFAQEKVQKSSRSWVDQNKTREN